MNAIFNNAVNDEICLRINGQPGDGEVAVPVTPQELIAEDAYGNRDETWMMGAAYWYQDGKCVPRPPEDVQAMLDAASKDSAYTKALGAFEARRNKEDKKLFPYVHKDIAYLFHSKKGAIQGTQNKCLVNRTDTPIQTFVGKSYEGGWFCLDNTDPDNPLVAYCPFTEGEFLAFADEYFLRESNNYTVFNDHIIALTGLNTDPDKTAADIQTYTTANLSIGWY